MRNLKGDSVADIERGLIADADNVDAWDALITVAPTKSPRPEWYKAKQIPIGMTLANCSNVDAHEVYESIAHRLIGATAYAFRPKGLSAAALDFYLVLTSLASAMSIANVVWTAYDRFIAPRKRQKDDSAGIYIAVQRPNGEVIHLWLGNDVSTQKEFLRKFAELVVEASDPELRPAHDAKLQELQDSDSWLEITEDS